MPDTAEPINRKPPAATVQEPMPSRAQRSPDAPRQPRGAHGTARERPIHLVAYRIDPRSMRALFGLPHGCFHLHEAERLEEVLSLSRPGSACDMILVGCEVGQQTPPERVDALRQLRPGQPLGMLCPDDRCAGLRAVELLRAGVVGIFPTTLATAALASAIRLVLDGGRYAPPEMLVALEVDADGSEGGGQSAANGDAMDARLAVLSKREREVARLLAQGLANKEIAFRLDLQEVTIKVHATSIYRKLGVRNRAQAVAKLLVADVDGQPA